MMGEPRLFGPDIPARRAGASTRTDSQQQMTPPYEPGTRPATEALRARVRNRVKWVNNPAPGPGLRPPGLGFGRVNGYVP